MRVNNRVDPFVPEFGVVRDTVRTEYLTDKRRAADEDLYERLREQYEIDIAWPAGMAPAGDDARR